MSQSNRSGFETERPSAGLREEASLNPTVVVLKQNHKVVMRTKTMRSQSNRSGFETEDVLKKLDPRTSLNPTVVVLKPVVARLTTPLVPVSIQP